MAYPQDPWAQLDAGEKIDESSASRRRRRAKENHNLTEWSA